MRPSLPECIQPDLLTCAKALYNETEGTSRVDIEIAANISPSGKVIERAMVTVGNFTGEQPMLVPYKSKGGGELRLQPLLLEMHEYARESLRENRKNKATRLAEEAYKLGYTLVRTEDLRKINIFPVQTGEKGEPL